MFFHLTQRINHCLLGRQRFPFALCLLPDIPDLLKLCLSGNTLWIFGRQFFPFPFLLRSQTFRQNSKFQSIVLLQRFFQFLHILLRGNLISQKMFHLPEGGHLLRSQLVFQQNVAILLTLSLLILPLFHLLLRRNMLFVREPVLHHRQRFLCLLTGCQKCCIFFLFHTKIQRFTNLGLIFLRFLNLPVQIITAVCLYLSKFLHLTNTFYDAILFTQRIFHIRNYHLFLIKGAGLSVWAHFSGLIFQFVIHSLKTVDVVGVLNKIPQFRMNAIGCPCLTILLGQKYRPPKRSSINPK